MMPCEGKWKAGIGRIAIALQIAIRPEPFSWRGPLLPYQPALRALL